MQLPVQSRVGGLIGLLCVLTAVALPPACVTRAGEDGKDGRAGVMGPPGAQGPEGLPGPQGKEACDRRTWQTLHAIQDI